MFTLAALMFIGAVFCFVVHVAENRNATAPTQDYPLPTVYTLVAVPSHSFICEGQRYVSNKPFDWAAVEAFVGDIEAGDWRSLV